MEPRRHGGTLKTYREDNGGATFYLLYISREIWTFPRVERAYHRLLRYVALRYACICVRGRGIRLLYYILTRFFGKMSTLYTIYILIKNLSIYVLRRTVLRHRLATVDAAALGHDSEIGFVEGGVVARWSKIGCVTVA